MRMACRWTMPHRECQDEIAPDSDHHPDYRDFHGAHVAGHRYRHGNDAGHGHHYHRRLIASTLLILILLPVFYRMVYGKEKKENAKESEKGRSQRMDTEAGNGNELKPKVRDSLMRLSWNC